MSVRAVHRGWESCVDRRSPALSDSGLSRVTPFGCAAFGAKSDLIEGTGDGLVGIPCAGRE